jgi:hypothetical protein
VFFAKIPFFSAKNQPACLAGCSMGLKKRVKTRG